MSKPRCLIPAKTMYCSCGKRHDISRTALFPEWEEQAFRCKHSAVGHHLVDRETWEHIRKQQAHYAIEHRKKQGSSMGPSRGGSEG